VAKRLPQLAVGGACSGGGGGGWVFNTTHNPRLAYWPRKDRGGLVCLISTIFIHFTKQDEQDCFKSVSNISSWLPQNLSPESTVACRLSEARRSRQVWHNWHTHASTMKFLNSTSQSESNFNSRWPRYPGLRFAGCYSR
jgi:hypothetical protein